MKAIIQNITGGHTASAKVVDGTLILSLPDAIDPVVWRMELGHVRASAIEVRSLDNGNFMLTLKTPKGDVNDIAPYASRAKAVGALLAVSRAMEQAHGQIPYSAAALAAATNPDGSTPLILPAAPRRPVRISQIAAAFAGLLLVAFLLTIFMNIGPQAPHIDPAGGTANLPRTDLSGLGGGEIPAGEPVSAEDFLRNR